MPTRPLGCRCFWFLLCSLYALACSGDKIDHGREMDDTGSGGNTAAPGSGGAPAAPVDAGGLDNASGGSHAGGAQLDAGCGFAGCGHILNIDSGRVDLLFVVDDSTSMREEQVALAAEFPRMLRKLTSGDHDEDGTPELKPVTDLHLGLVSTDLGTDAVFGAACNATGDDGRLLHTSVVDGCDKDYPTFLEYQQSNGDADTLAKDFACMAQLGTHGCGYEQPLESALKAVWPSSDTQIEFLASVGNDIGGRADRENAGFIRTGEAPATLAIVVVTDEDDCSAYDPTIWTAPQYLAPDDPRVDQSVNLRCFYNKESLYPIDRYLNGYRGVHAGDGARVLFAAIAGIPIDLVDQNARAKVDFGDDAQREAFYQKILDDPRMKEAPDPDAGTTDMLPDELKPACKSAHGLAYPGRRIVELARSFGQAGLVQSICGDNFGPPTDIILKKLAGPD